MQKTKNKRKEFHKMKQICKTLGTISLVLGIIGSFALAGLNGTTLSISRFGDLEKVRNWPLTIIIFATSLLCVAAFSFILMGIAEILERLESITWTQQTLIKNTTSETEDEPPQSYWKCPECGRSNPPYTGTCGCGYSKN